MYIITAKRITSGLVLKYRKGLRFVMHSGYAAALSSSSHFVLTVPERAMQRFRSMGSLQKFASVHASVCNHFNQERSLYSRDNFKLNRTAALSEWRQLCSA